MKLAILMFGFFGLGINTGHVTAQNTVTVDIVGQGKVEGIEEATSGPIDSSMYAFYGIPYGKDTSGDNRFKPTSYPDPWIDTRDCKQPNLDRICPQLDKQRSPVGQEDCLDLSVYTPNIPQDDSEPLLPVLVFLHAGKFMRDNNYVYHGANILNSKEIVLVVPNHRIGLLGFMCLQDEEAPCNAGLYDQILALQWVKDYIKHFGGDANRVTLAGTRSGAIAANYLMLYQDANKDYFQQVIIAGPTSLSISAIDESPVASAEEFGSLADCDTSDTATLIACMKTVPADTLTTILYRNFIDKGFTGAFPAVQQVGTNKIISDMPRSVLQQDPPSFTVVPTFIGTPLHPGSKLVGMFYKLTGMGTDPEWWTTSCIPILLGLNNSPGVTGDDILNTYFGGVYPANFSEGMGSLIDGCSTIFFKSGVDETASLIQSAGGDVFIYSFDYEGSITTFNFGPIPVFSGVAPGDDIIYIFSNSSSFTSNDIAARDNLIKVWINFIKTGNPGENTPIYTATDRGYLEITDSFAIRDDFRDTFFPCKGVNGDEDNCVYTP